MSDGLPPESEFAPPPQNAGENWRDRVRQKVNGLRSRFRRDPRAPQDTVISPEAEGAGPDAFVSSAGEPDRDGPTLAGFSVARERAGARLSGVADFGKRTFESLAERARRIPVRDWFRRGHEQDLQRQKLGFYGRLFTVLLCAYLLAAIPALFLENLIPEPPVVRLVRSAESVGRTRSVDDYQAIMARNLFNSKGLIPGEDGTGAGGGEVDMNAPAVKTSLPLNLVGTLILRDELRSIATIEDKSASIVYPVRVKDEIPSKAKILLIEATRVTFVNTSSGRKEYIDLPEDLLAKTGSLTVGRPRGATGGIEQVSPTQFNIARGEVDKAMSDFNQVLTQARCVPNFENGLPNGYKCFQIVPGSIYDKLGIKDGDIVLGINNQDLSDPGKLLSQLSELKNTSHIDLSLKRGGKQLNYAYDIR